MAYELTDNSYGKSKVRLTKVVRNGAFHELYEMSADIQLEGDFTAAYTQGDNRKVVATDTIKNTVYVVGKEKNFTSVEEFASLLAGHFLATYSWVVMAKVELYQAMYRRIPVGGKGHAHSFTLDGPQKRYAKAYMVRGGELKVVGGIRGQVVLKTTASEWKDFHTDRYRTLKDATDRILATTIDADWTYVPGTYEYNAAVDAINGAILTTFATKHSLGAQQTIFDMGHAALDACKAINTISFTLPNLHRIPFNLEPFDLKFENDIFVATDEPHGLIHGTVERK